MTSHANDVTLCCRDERRWRTGVRSGSYLAVDTVATSLALLMNLLAFLSQETMSPEVAEAYKFFCFVFPLLFFFVVCKLYV